MKAVRALESKYVDTAAWLYCLGVEFSPYTMTVIHPEQAVAALTAPDAQFWIYVRDGKIAGLGGFEKIRFIDRVAEPYIAVHPDFQRQGLGWEIAEHLWQMKEVLNLRRIQSIVLEDSPSREYLVNLGFKQEGVLKAMRLREGKPVNGLLFGWVRE